MDTIIQTNKELPTKTLLTVKTDKWLKKAADETAKELGLPLGTIINAYLRQFVQDKEVTFAKRLTPTAYTKYIIEKSEKEFLEDDIKVYSSTSDLFSALKI